MLIKESYLRSIIRQSLLKQLLSEKLTAVSKVATKRAQRRQGVTSRASSRDEDISGVDSSTKGSTQGGNKLGTLSNESQPAFRNFIQMANDAGITISVVSTHRFPSHQWNLKYGKNKITGNPVAEPCWSGHQYGYAADINASYKDNNGKNIRASMKSSKKSWEPVVAIAAKAGLSWLGMADPVHFYFKKTPGSLKRKCDDFYTRKLGTSDRESWEFDKMASLENDPELKNILKISESKQHISEKLTAVSKVNTRQAQKTQRAASRLSSETEDVVDITKMSTSQRQLYDDLFMSLNNKNLCIAMVANAIAESALNYSIAGDCGSYGKKNKKRAINTKEKGLCCSFGLWQFNICGGLGITLLRAYGVDVDNSTTEEKLSILSDYNKQIDFMTRYVKRIAGPSVSDEKTIDEWVEWFVVKVEKPKRPARAIVKRTAIAKKISVV